jgi:hypothetical protein
MGGLVFTFEDGECCGIPQTEGEVEEEDKG